MIVIAIVAGVFVFLMGCFILELFVRLEALERQIDSVNGKNKAIKRKVDKLYKHFFFIKK